MQSKHNQPDISYEERFWQELGKQCKIKAETSIPQKTFLVTLVFVQLDTCYNYNLIAFFFFSRGTVHNYCSYSQGCGVVHCNYLVRGNEIK